MKTLNKLFLIALSVLLTIVCLFAFVGCKEEQELNPNTNSEKQEDDFLNELDFVFHTEYTETEHIQRIKQKTQERLADDFEGDKIDNFSVEILYSFYTNDPEWFLVEVEYKQEFSGEIAFVGNSNAPTGERYTTKYKHIIGRIYQDKYFIVALNNEDFVDGKSPYNALGYSEYKKYYGHGTFAVEKDGQILTVFNGYSNESNYLFLGLRPFESEPWNFQKEIISIAAQKNIIKLDRNSHDANVYIFLSDPSSYY